MTDGLDDLFGDFHVLRREAQTHLQARRWIDAAECLQVLAAIDPQDVWVRQWQVIATIALGKPEVAVEAARVALQALPADAQDERADVAFNLGQALALLGRNDEALDAFDLALSHDPALECARQARARLLRKR